MSVDDRPLYLALGACLILVGGIIVMRIPDHLTLGVVLVVMGIGTIILDGILKFPISRCKQNQEEIDANIRGFPGLKDLLSLYEDPSTHRLLLQDEMLDLSRNIAEQDLSIGAYHLLAAYYYADLRAAGVSLV